MASGAGGLEPCDVLVIGSGVAGFLTALKAAHLGRVVVVTKRAATDSTTRFAQGGIASVMDRSDSYAAHVADTLKAGAGICRGDVVETVVRQGPRVIRELMDLGARFSQAAASGDLELGREGGHSANRIVHFKDVTGQEIQRALHEAVRADPRITVSENSLAVNLLGGRRRGAGRADEWRVHGAYVLRGDGTIEPQMARVTVLATGGCGKAYLYTSNPDLATGDGIAMAFRAGARIANVEFVQFHPTCLYDPTGSRFLVSEAVRGEGAVLRNGAGEEFMTRYDARRELAPRDVVARAIDQEMKRRGDKFVYLDVRHLGERFLRQRFPNIHEACAQIGVRMERDLVPVVPAAHYMCGGILVDSHGRTDLPGLYAVGETSCTGLHGANRLASNSLLEALVFADRAVADIAAQRLQGDTPVSALPWSAEGTSATYETVVLDHDWDSVRRLLWDYVGIVRSDDRLEIAAQRLEVLRRGVESYYWRYRLSPDLVELRNLALVGELIVRCARFRQESRGLHHTSNWPHTRPEFRGDTVLSRFEQPHLLPTDQPVLTAAIDPR
ncbi:MAG: L-aspartate oxidase [Candidatus Krumholzibacteriia bacterium]